MTQKDLWVSRCLPGALSVASSRLIGARGCGRSRELLNLTIWADAVTASPRLCNMPPGMLFNASQLCSPDTYPDHPYSSWPALKPSPRGRLELLTADITAAAARSEILTGKRFSLDHSLYPSGALLYGRVAATHKVKRVDGGPKTREEAASGKGRRYHPVFDDCVSFNTQGTTQWDYFMHYSYRNSGLFYGGLTADRIQSGQTGGIGVKGERILRRLARC